MLKSDKKYPIDCIYSIPTTNTPGAKPGATKDEKLEIN